MVALFLIKCKVTFRAYPLPLPQKQKNVKVMNWILLILAGLIEVCFTLCLGKTKQAVGSDYYLWGLGFIASISVSMYLLAKATQTLPIGTAYPVWTGIGAVGTVLVGIVFFHEPVTLGRLFFISTLIISIIGLKLV